VRGGGKVTLSKRPPGPSRPNKRRTLALRGLPWEWTSKGGYQNEGSMDNDFSRRGVSGR